VDTTAAVEHSFSLSGLISHADPVVLGVLAVLAFCSVSCWGLILEKMLRISILNAKVRQLEFYATLPNSAYVGHGSLVSLLSAAADAEDIAPGETRSDYQHRLERAMRLRAKVELRRAESGLSFLATVGSTAPFIGLFGTVWGIMHSFSSIAQAKDTSLAVVAPGISEALFATAIGLAAAIPAVVAYNQITTGLGRTAERISGAVVGLARDLASRAAAYNKAA
jgi:biopolymer transport protein ExbB/TolQ